jgi:hypothetical protein
METTNAPDAAAPAPDRPQSVRGEPDYGGPASDAAFSEQVWQTAIRIFLTQRQPPSLN